MQEAILVGSRWLELQTDRVVVVSRIDGWYWWRYEGEGDDAKLRPGGAFTFLCGDFYRRLS